MKRPRSLFRGRPHRPGVLYVGLPSPPSYLAKALAAVEGKVLPGTVREVRVYHADDCPAPAGGDCRCDPEVKLFPTPEEN